MPAPGAQPVIVCCSVPWHYHCHHCRNGYCCHQDPYHLITGLVIHVHDIVVCVISFIIIVSVVILINFIVAIDLLVSIVTAHCFLVNHCSASNDRRSCIFIVLSFLIAGCYCYCCTAPPFHLFAPLNCPTYRFHLLCSFTCFSCFRGRRSFPHQVVFMSRMHLSVFCRGTC